MQNINNPKLLPSEFASQGTTNEIPLSPSGASPQLANFQQGFPAITQQPVDLGGLPPERADFNGLFNLALGHNYFMQNGGGYTFNEDVSNAIGGYPLNAVLWYFGSDGDRKIVVSNRANNTYNFNTDSGYIGDSNAPWSIASGASNGAGIPLGTIMTYDHPVSLIGLELLDGRLISSCDTTYPDFWEYVVGLKKSSGSEFDRYKMTEQQWQQELTAKGFCGWYVVDENAKSVRLPKLNNSYLQSYSTGDVDKSAGLPNIQGDVGSASGSTRSAYTVKSGAFVNSSFRTGGLQDGGRGGDLEPIYTSNINFNANSSNPIYGNSSTVQTDSVGVYYYIVVDTISTSVTSSTLNSLQRKSNLVTTLSADSTNQQYPSAKLVYDLIGDIEQALEEV